MVNVIEAEVSTPLCENLQFLPINRLVRGRFDFNKLTGRDRSAADGLRDWPHPIPGQVIGINPDTGEAWLREPLYDQQHAVTRRKIEKNFQLPAERETFQGVHVPTWLYWLKRAVDSNTAVIVVGKLPDTIEGEPNLSLFKTPLDASTDKIDKLCTSIGQLVNAFAEIAKALTAKSGK